MSVRARQWLAMATVLTFVAAVIVAYSGVMNARSTPRWQQTAPGATLDPLSDGGMPMRLESLLVTGELITDKEPAPAEPGTVWVVATITYQPPPQGGHCALNLVAVDGRSWEPITGLELDGGERELERACLNKPGEGSYRSELIYQIPASAASSIAGLGYRMAGERTTDAFPLLTPAA